jgi:hypothetical protein
MMLYAVDLIIEKYDESHSNWYQGSCN